MEIKDIIGKKVAIWCDTEEKANDFLFKVKDFTKSKQDSNYFTNYFENTCYCVYYGHYTYSEKKYCEREGYFIISYNDFFGISEQVESETLTTVEVLVGTNEIIERITKYERKNRKETVSDEEITLLLDEKYGVGKWVRK